MDFSPFTVAIAIFVGFVVFKVLFSRGKADGRNLDWPFYPRKPLSQPEQILYFRLTNALPDHVVLAQVQLSRFLGVKKGNNYHSWLNRINRMSADFVVCRKDLSILAVIELDDSSHESEGRQSADAKKDKAIRSAGLALHRWHVKNIPSEGEIKGRLLKPLEEGPV